MKVLIDTNIILDVLCNRKEFVLASSTVIKMCEVRKIEGYVSAMSFPNIAYILRKELTSEKTKEIVNNLCLIFNVVDLKSVDLKKATELNINDYEDAIQSASAMRIKASYIITRNIKDFKNSKIPAILPEEFLVLIQ